MKRAFCLNFLLVILISATVGNQTALASDFKSENGSVNKALYNKIDPSLKLFMNFGKSSLNKTAAFYKGTINNSTIQVIKNNDEIYLPVLIKVTNPLDAKNVIERNGGKMYVTAGDIVTAKIPASSIMNLAADKSIIQIDASHQRKLMLDKARVAAKADLVQNGTDLPQSYKGKGVIIGVVDSGIDWAHPDFNDENGSRVRYLWDQTGTGIPPVDFDYGAEWTKADMDNGISTETDEGGHGTHVAGIAAGNGSANSSFIGMAPEAELVIVKYNRSNSFRAEHTAGDFDVINACSYIFEKADELEMPAVINLSLGWHNGAHDGTGNVEQALNNLSGSGKVIVFSAGNEGDENRHATAALNNGDDPKNLNFDLKLANSGISAVDLWYGQNDSISVSLQGLQIDGDSSTYFYESDIVKPGEELADIIAEDGDTIRIYIDATVTQNPNNGMQRIYVLLGGIPISKDYSFRLLLSGNGKFNAWYALLGEFLTVTSPDAIQPDRFMTIGVPATAERVICVGSYATKNQWIDVNDELQDYSQIAKVDSLSDFSSIGPTLDGRIKPDIVAPGQFIIAANSNLGNDFPENWIFQDTLLVASQGTSMSAPLVAGVVALLLQANPDLTPEEVKSIIQTTAITDEYTGTVPNNFYGMGKLDAQAAMQDVVTSVDSDMEIPYRYSLEQCYPNPFNPSTTISYSIPKQSNVSLKVYDVLGREVVELLSEEKPAGNYDINFDASSLSCGVYFYTLETNEFFNTRKMLLIK